MIGRLLLGLLLILPLLAMTGDSKEIVSDGVTFQATILTVTEKHLLVEPVAGSSELRSADRIVIHQTGLIDLTTLKEGDTLEITYNGLIAESYPAQIWAIQIRVIDPSS